MQTHTHTLSHFSLSLTSLSLSLLSLSLTSLSLSLTHSFTHTHTVSITFSSVQAFFTNEYERSYKCKKESFWLTANGTNNATDNTSISNKMKLELGAWQVQAFEFREEHNFGNGMHIISLSLSLPLPPSLPPSLPHSLSPSLSLSLSPSLSSSLL